MCEFADLVEGVREEEGVKSGVDEKEWMTGTDFAATLVAVLEMQQRDH